MNSRQRRAAQILTAAIAAVFLAYGLWRGEGAEVLNKAVNVCMECIGLG